ncbi:urease accessory protein UreF [Corynebacterium cystitidis]|uniref:Urease accessory protein UreF n=1 Tax=Corynebacterium cystitidis DSM 20524 TaxID=1121357 RepID=A0A1H9UKK2_9CORY|nr:urease accessory UreF family protein [Corynebacterium cystitidis]WJY81009.1 Urease accessory protein UreF [Corynebacterium cystitidis DSM 20524]SES09986.1 urease accessory protein [Corynebacterium cystitidis DSM 20524]SNV90714.1 urease accessory protein [Corynebacterium cystitidis]
MQNIPTSRRAQLVVWHLTDSALPTGGFAHSAGLETYVQADDVHNPETYGAWLHGYLRQASFNDALAVKLAVELHTSSASEDEKLAGLEQLDTLLHAAQTPKQVRVSMNSMGKRMARVASIVAPEDVLVDKYEKAITAREMHGNPGIAAGLALAASGVDQREAVDAYLMQMANSMTQNAIRAIPLGQDAGQRVLVGAYPAIERAGDMTMEHTVADLGVVAPRLEIAQMQHEALRSRMFMS